MSAAQAAAAAVSAALKSAVVWRAELKDALAGTLQYATLPLLEDLCREGAAFKVCVWAGLWMLGVRCPRCAR
jgi:hypothetical protein